MASLRNIRSALKLLFLFFVAFLLIIASSRVSATENPPSLPKASRTRKVGTENRNVGKGVLEGKRAVYDWPWGGGYNPPVIKT